MSGKTIKIRPKHGIVLAGIPAAGGDVPLELGREWIDARLAVEIKPDPPATTKRPAARPAMEG